MIAYFGYGTNRDHDMMAAMVGRGNLEGVKGTLSGYELVIQDLEDITNQVSPIAPVPRSPREIMATALGDSAKLYIIRPSPSAVTYGTIWQISEDEYEMVRDWELLDFGMQEDIKVQVRTESGSPVEAQTHGSNDAMLSAGEVVVDENYENYLVPREVILETAKRVHQEFLDRQTQVNS